MSIRDLAKELRNWAALGAAGVEIFRGIRDLFRRKPKPKTVRAPLITPSDLKSNAYVIEGGKIRDAKENN